jgi:Protein of unknown function (DUF1592)/Protein of unknown function (DUF1588)/Protein of unknown function (DUF1595)/Protein of unknown function (DUF1587)/Protein of unknown function (DUF1585)
MKSWRTWGSALLIAALGPAGLVPACRDSSQSGGGWGGVAGESPTSTAAAGDGAAGASAGSTTPDGGAGAPATNLPPPANKPLTPESAGQLVMRRLTNREYDNIMVDLLGDTTAPGTTFPLDGPTSTGFEAPNSVADLNVQYYFQAADALAETALSGGHLTIPCQNPSASAESACATQFVTQFGQRAYRRPLADAEKTDLLTLFSTVRGLGLSFNETIAQLVKAMLQSPNFLYHWEIGPTKPAVDPVSGLVPLTSWQVASRLAETLWESMPDDALLSAAQGGQLATAAQVDTQAQRMLTDPRASRALFNFHSQWLLQVNGHVTDVNELVKTSALFTASVQQSLGTEFTQFLSSVYATGDGTLGTLFSAPYSFVNHDIAAIYGVTAPATGFAKVALDPTQRAGILTQAAFLAANADPSTDNPVRRGLAIYVNVLCGQVNPPPPVVPAIQPPSTTLTTRQRFEAHAQQACAMGCHNIFDPPGFAFENYDAVGAYRTTESGQPVDATGTFTTPGGAQFTFQGGVDLAKQLAQSSEAEWCVDRQWTRYMLGRMETSAEQGSLELAYRSAAATSGYSLRDMVLSLLASKALLYRTPSPGEPL